MRSVNSASTFVLIAASLCAGCASPGVTDQLVSGRLPFHVAVVGVAVQNDPTADGESGAAEDVKNDADRETMDASEQAMLLKADNRLLSTLLARELAERAFTRATAIVSPPSEGLEGLRQAVVDSGADMVLLCQLNYGSPIHYERTSPVLLNLGLFLVGGPFIWLIDEYTYYAQAELTVSLFDLGGVGSTGANPGDPAAQILAAETSFAGLETDFIDRVSLGSKGAATSYLASLFTSTFVVGQEGDEVAAMVSAQALSALGTQVSDLVLARRDDVLRAESQARLAEITLDSLKVTYDGLNYVDINAQVTVHGGGDEARLSHCLVDIGGRVEDWKLGQGVVVGEGPSAARSYEIRLLIPDVDEGQDTFRLALLGGADKKLLRTYTMAIPAAND